MCKNSLWRDGYQVLGGCLVMQCGDRLWDEWWNRSSGEGVRHSNGWLSSVVVPTYVHAARPLAGRLLDLMARTKKKKSGGRAQVAKHLNLHAYLPPFSRRLLPVPPPPGLGPPGHTWVSSASELPPPHPTAEDLRCWGWQASTPNSLACGAREEPESKEAYPPSRCAHLSVLAASKQDKAATHTGRRWRTLMYTPLASRRKTKASQVLLVTTRP